MKPIVTLEEMKEMEEEGRKNGLTEREMMLRAAEVVRNAYPFKGNVAIVCGSGNNAGDGYALATLLKEKNCQITLYLITDRFSLEGKYYFQKCQEMGIPYKYCQENTVFDSYDVIVDAIYGTGFHGTMPEFTKKIVKNMNDSGKPIVSIDINSGLNAENGLTDFCVKSSLTVAIENYKEGHFLNQAKDNRRSLAVGSIGLITKHHIELMEKEDIKKVIPNREEFSNKGTYGKSLLIGGSLSYSGAIKLANLSLSCLKVGSGLTTLAVPENIASAVAPFLLESTLYPLKEKEGKMKWEESSFRLLLTKATSIGIGMGWGEGEDYEKILTFLIKESEVPLIIDADGLNTLAKMEKSILKEAQAPIILTPHLMEFSRLSKTSREEILQNPVEIAKSFAKEYNIILLLKGPTTIVTDGQDTIFVDQGSKGMATAGSGDVLTGIITGLCSYCLPTIKTVGAAAYLNGLAGLTAERKKGSLGMTAKDTIDALPEVLKEILGF